MNCKDTIFEDNGFFMFTAKIIKDQKITYVPQTGFQTREEAEKAAERLDDKFKSEIKTLKNTLIQPTYTLRSYMERWFRDFTTYADPTYVVGYNWVIHQVIFPAITEDIPLNRLTTTYLNDLLDRTAKVCKSSRPMSYKLLRLMLKDAYAEGETSENKIEGVTPLYWQQPPIIRYSKKQLKQLLQACKQAEYCYLEVLLACFVGLRAGEILGLKTEDIDLENNTVTINRQISNNFIVETNEDGIMSIHRDGVVAKDPKSPSSFRTLRFPEAIKPEIIQRIESNKKLYVLPEWKGYLCIGENGTIKNNNTPTCFLKRQAKLHGLPPINMHGLRHVYASLLLEQRVELPLISKLMGHKSIETTLNTYCGIIEGMDELRDYVDQSMDPIGGVAK